MIWCSGSKENKSRIKIGFEILQTLTTGRRTRKGHEFEWDIPVLLFFIVEELYHNNKHSGNDNMK